MNFSADVQEKMHDEYINVEYTGVVRWVPPAIYKSSCQIDMRDFPFDEQTCMFKFGSWAYNGNKLTLAFNEGLVDLDMREFVESSEWDVMHTSAEKHVRVYPCCPDEPYPDLTFYLTLRRRTAFYVYVLILPSVLLSSLTLVLFWIPPQRPDRTSLGKIVCSHSVLIVKHYRLFFLIITVPMLFMVYCLRNFFGFKLRCMDLYDDYDYLAITEGTFSFYSSDNVVVIIDHIFFTIVFLLYSYIFIYSYMDCMTLTLIYTISFGKIIGRHIIYLQTKLYCD